MSHDYGAVTIGKRGGRLAFAGAQNRYDEVIGYFPLTSAIMLACGW